MVKKSTNSPKRSSRLRSVSLSSIRGWQPNYIGLVLSLLFLVFSLLPSLLPRPWIIQGIISGASMAIGYGIGLAISAMTRWFMEKEVAQSYKDKAWSLLDYSVLPILFISLYFGRVWQNEVRSLIGVEPISAGYSLFAVLLTAVVFIGLIKLSRVIRRLSRKIRSYITHRVPARISAALAILLSAFLVYFLVSGVFVRNFYKVADGIYSTRDHTAPEGIVQPTNSNKSGSPESLIAWEKIGFQGRGFVGSGPSADEISAYTGNDALEPIRAYAGLATAETAEQRADLAVAELVRTNAFEREVLVIATATGTGWLDPTVVDTLEYMHGGDTAIVSQQYSYLPSWISFLVDQDRAREAGRVLYDAVIEEWASRPEESRPKLLVYGLSLGSFGGQTAFSGPNDIRRSVDGALFTGTPNDTELWRRITNARDQGSPEWQPVINGGESVRFASTKEDMLANQEQWNDETRILYVQHANDPVVWFSFDLIFNKPDWLDEQRGRAVSPSTRYFPIVTFLHIGLDQAIAASAPIGEGHYYIDTTAYAWAAIAPPTGWTTEDSERLQAHINN